METNQMTIRKIQIQIVRDVKWFQRCSSLKTWCFIYLLLFLLNLLLTLQGISANLGPLLFEPPNMLIPATFLPMGNQLSFLWMGNQLSWIVRKHVHDYEAFQIYILDFYSEKWPLYHKMGIFYYIAACVRKLIISFLEFCYWIHRQIIFQVTIRPMKQENLPKDRYTMHYSYNVKTRKLTKIEGISMGYHEVRIYTNILIVGCYNLLSKWCLIVFSVFTTSYRRSLSSYTKVGCCNFWEMKNRKT